MKKRKVGRVVHGHFWRKREKIRKTQQTPTMNQRSGRNAMRINHKKE